MAIKGTAGDDNLSGNGADNVFKLGQGGDDIALGKGGNDTFQMGDALTAADSLNGGDGADRVIVKALVSSSAQIVFGAGTIVNVETLRLAGSVDYDLTLHDANVAAGAVLAVEADKLGAGAGLTFDGSAELDGRFEIHASASNDTIFGGAPVRSVLLRQWRN